MPRPIEILLLVATLDFVVREPTAAGSAVREQVPEIEVCVAITSSGRLHYGQTFVAALPRGLELRLRAEDDFGWQITVGRRGGEQDYMWVASPPYQTAPQRHIGPVYGLTAREAVSFGRELRFVLSEDDYQAALRIVNAEVGSPEKRMKIERLGKGRLTLAVTKFDLRQTATPQPFAEALDWIEFSGEACVPR